MLPAFHVGHSIGIFTCQTAPGTEKELCNQLYDVSQKRIQVFYDALSDFDVIGIAADIDLDDSDLSNIFIDNTTLRDIQLITCFPLFPEKDDQKYNDAFKQVLENYDLMTITLINTSKFFQQPVLSQTDAPFTEKVGSKNLAGKSLHEPGDDRLETGFERELSIAKKIQAGLISFQKKPQENSDPEFEFWIFGTLGMPNMVLIQAGNTIETLLKNLVDLNTIDIEEVNFFHTITCLRRYEAVASETNDSSKNPKNNQATLLWRIGITCYGTATKVIEETLLHNSDIGPKIELSNSFGKRDITIQPKDLNPDTSNRSLKFIKSVLDQIGNLRNIVSETKTILSLPFQSEPEVELPMLSDSTNNGIALDLEISFSDLFSIAEKLHKEESRLKRPDMALGWKLIDTIQRYQLTYQTPAIKELIIDMYQNLKTIGQQANLLRNELYQFMQTGYPFPTFIRELYEELDRSIRVFNYALDKQLAGVELGIGNKVVTSVSGLGSSRTLLAIKAVGDGLFKAAHEDWDGFTILGYVPTILCLPNGIINMSDLSIQLLGSWTKLAHETGHAYIIQKNLFSQYPFLLNLKNDLSKVNLGEMAIRSDPGEFIEELLANLFEYFFAYGMDFQKYRDVTWKNLDRDLSPNESLGHIGEHLLRTACVLTIHLQINKLLIPQESVNETLNKALQAKNVYGYRSIEEGVRARRWLKVGSFETMLNEEIIEPLQTSGVCHWLFNDLSRINREQIYKIYQVIDPYRNSIYEIFTRNQPDLPDALDQFQVKNYLDLLMHHKICRIRPEHPGDVFLLILAVNELENRRIIEKQKSALERSNNFESLHPWEEPYYMFSPADQITVILSLWDYYFRAFLTE
jgi:hypothetical protein